MANLRDLVAAASSTGSNGTAAPTVQSVSSSTLKTAAKSGVAA